VMTQGRGDGKEWLTSFMVSYSTFDVNQWQYVADQYGNRKVRRSLPSCICITKSVNVRLDVWLDVCRGYSSTREYPIPKITFLNNRFLWLCHDSVT